MARLARTYFHAVEEGAIHKPWQVIDGGRSDSRSSGTDLSSSDEAYAIGLAKGQADAVELFMSRNLPVILGMARRLLNDETEAEDAAQEVFIKVWKNADSWTPGRARLDSWIGRIAINHCYDRLRRKRPELRDEFPEQSDGRADANQMLSSQQSQITIRQAVSSLPDRQKLALELCHFQEVTNIEAAEIMEVSVEALESLLSRGRRKLKILLAGSASDLLEDFADAKGEN